AFLLTAKPVRVEIEGAMSWVLPVKSLSAEGLFLAILCGLVSVEVARFFIRKPAATPSQDERIPAAVGQAFASFGPMLLMVSFVWVLRDYLGFDLSGMLQGFLKP